MMYLDFLAVFFAGSIYFCLKQLWYSSYLFGIEPLFPKNPKKLWWLVEVLAACLLALFVQVTLMILSSPSTRHGLLVGALFSLGLLLPSSIFSIKKPAQWMIDQLFQLLGMLFLGAFLGS
ncbi:MAG: hypothetical protein AAGI90_02080 [Chlamydiota bacterium]